MESGPLLLSSLTIPKALNPSSLNTISYLFLDQANTAVLARGPFRVDGWCLDRQFQKCNELTRSSSLTAHFTDMKTKGQGGKGFTQTSCCPPNACDPEGQVPNLLEHSKCIKHICSQDWQ